jgi:hypothetical protein
LQTPHHPADVQVKVEEQEHIVAVEQELELGLEVDNEELEVAVEE